MYYSVKFSSEHAWAPQEWTNLFASCTERAAEQFCEDWATARSLTEFDFLPPDELCVLVKKENGYIYTYFVNVQRVFKAEVTPWKGSNS